MAWTAPMTAVAGSAFTAAQFNTYVRDNFMETAVAKATQSGSIFCGDGPNKLVERVPVEHTIVAVESTSSTSFTDLNTVGPTVTVQTGANALICINARAVNSTDQASAFASVEVSGASNIPATVENSLQIDMPYFAISNGHRAGIAYIQTGLTPGLNTFTMKYRVYVGTAQYRRRQISVIPF